ncbi:hypothetical protein ScalyP_jg6770 [Parmales sp. scaly parma]|nr:hypothetical protein ScalyP_jg6770 [Parmales sp. scaly parma]
MTIFSTGVGATLGLALQFYSNGVRKLPLWRQPWLHVSFIIGGAYAGHCYPAIEQKQRDDVNMIRREKNLPPLVGSGPSLVKDLYSAKHTK